MWIHEILINWIKNVCISSYNIYRIDERRNWLAFLEIFWCRSVQAVASWDTLWTHSLCLICKLVNVWIRIHCICALIYKLAWRMCSSASKLGIVNEQIFRWTHPFGAYGWRSELLLGQYHITSHCISKLKSLYIHISTGTTAKSL